MKKEIEKFDKYLKKISNNNLHAVGEVGEILLSLIKIQPDTNMQPLIDRVSEYHDFSSVDEMNKFFDLYFTFHNKFINYISTLMLLQDEEKFAYRIDEMVKNLLCCIPIKEQKLYIVEFVHTIYEEVFEEFAFDADTSKNSRKALDEARKKFGSEELALLFFSLFGIIQTLEEEKNITQAMLVEISTPAYVFLLALNEQRKNNFIANNNTPKQQQSVNDPFYNVGRNDPCPCGSGRKYKKCCLIKHERKTDTKISVSKPKDSLPLLTQKEIEEFYKTWSRFFEFASKIYCDIYNKKYQKSYIKDEFGRFTLDEKVIESNLALEVRRFIGDNLVQLCDDFKNHSKVKKEIEIMEELSISYKFSTFSVVSLYEDGSALLFDMKDNITYLVYPLYDPFGVIFDLHQQFETTLFFYKGRIISDGIFGVYNIDMGQNMQKLLQNQFEESTNNIQIILSPNQVQHKIYQLKISIKGSKPRIWRKIQVPAQLSFYELHAFIQTLFGWDDCHLWEFIGKQGNYLDEEEISEGLFETKKEINAKKFSIETELKNEKDKILYVYDFGDDWVHEVVLEKILFEDEFVSPKFISGKRAAPFEDCGGIYAYNEIVDAIDNPNETNQDLLDDYGIKPFDTSDFDAKMLHKIFSGNK